MRLAIWIGGPALRVAASASGSGPPALALPSRPPVVPLVLEPAAVL